MNTSDLSVMQISSLRDLAEELLIDTQEEVHDANFAYFGEREGKFYMGFDTWHYGDRDRENYTNSALVEAVLDNGNWVGVKVAIFEDDHFYESIYPLRVKEQGYTHHVLK